MKKQVKSKSARRSARAKKSVHAREGSGVQAKIKMLQSQNMRLTRELDVLATSVATQSGLLSRMHLALQEKGVMAYEPVLTKAPDQVAREKVQMPIKATRGSVIFKATDSFSGFRDAACGGYQVRVTFLETTKGWMSEAGSLTLDPKKIKTFATEEEAKEAAKKSELGLPKGAILVVERCPWTG